MLDTKVAAKQTVLLPHVIAQVVERVERFQI